MCGVCVCACIRIYIYTSIIYIYIYICNIHTHTYYCLRMDIHIHTKGNIEIDPNYVETWSMLVSNLCTCVKTHTAKHTCAEHTRRQRSKINKSRRSLQHASFEPVYVCTNIYCETYTCRAHTKAASKWINYEEVWSMPQRIWKRRTDSC
jgi:hypothetical protein